MIASVKSLWDQCQGDKELTMLRNALSVSAVRYARIRVDWHLAEPEVRRHMDEERSRSHDALIDACNVLSRNMANRGCDIGWREALGEDRGAIGDFACLIHAYLGYLAK